MNGYENIDSNIFFEIKESKITRGHNFTLVKKQSIIIIFFIYNPTELDSLKVDWMLESLHFPRGPSMYGINYQQSASSVNMFKNRIDKYLVN